MLYGYLKDINNDSTLQSFENVDGEVIINDLGMLILLQYLFFLFIITPNIFDLILGKLGIILANNATKVIM